MSAKQDWDFTQAGGTRNLGDQESLTRDPPRQKRAARRVSKKQKRAERPTVPLEQVEVRHIRTDLIVISDEDGLPLGWLTAAICLDTATRYPLGYHLAFEPPSYLTVMECLYHAICQKEDLRELYGTEHPWKPYGKPSFLIVATEFTGRDLTDACLSLDIVLEPAPVPAATSEFDAGLEQALLAIPRTAFCNPRQRGGYRGPNLGVYLSEVHRTMAAYVVDTYAEKYQPELGGSPAERWEAAVQSGFSPNLPHSAEDLRILLGRVAYRTVQHYGVEFESLRYNCSELSALRARLKGKPTKIKYHPSDISHLLVLNPFTRTYIKVPALAQEYIQGLSLWRHRAIRSGALEEKRQVDLAALGEAKRKIQEIVQEGMRRRRAGLRTRAVARRRRDSQSKRRYE